MPPSKRLLILGAAALGGLWAYARRAVHRFEDLEVESAEAPGAYLQVNGTRVHYVEAGRGEPVVLIHGLGASTFSFRHTIPELGRHYRTIAFDLRGFGYSERPAGEDYSLTAQAALVQQAMSHLDIERAAVVGHSMGGAVAMRLALRYPERVSRLVLVDSATDRETRRGVRLSRYLRPLFPIIAPFTLQSRRFRRLALRTAVHDPAHLTPEVLAGYFRPTRMKGHLRAYAALAADRRRDEPLDPSRIRQPTLILWGEHDRWLPPSRGEELARQIPNARLVAVYGAGHMPLEEQPAVCNRALLEFLREAEPAAPPAQPAAAETPS